MANVIVDPYLEWADATRFVHFGQLKLTSGRGTRVWIPIILQLRKGTTAAEFAERVARSRQPGIQIPAVYRYPAYRLAGATYCTALVADSFVRQIVGRASGLAGLIERYELGLAVAGPELRAVPLESVDSQGTPIVVPANYPANPRLPRRTIAVIDDGLAFAHARFRDAHGKTRIDALWDQEPRIPAPTPHVPGLGYGREIVAADIDAWVTNATAPGTSWVDEDAVYRAADYRSVAKRRTHGAHVMDIACGESPREVTRSTPRIIGVQLGAQRTLDTSGRWLSVQVLNALRYVLDRADRLALKRGERRGGPIVANLSFGNTAGPHDGSTLLEQAMDELLRLRRSDDRRDTLAIVMPAGNHFLGRVHARKEIAGRETLSLRWRTCPDDATPSFLQLYPPTEHAARALRVELIAPSGEATGWVNANETKAFDAFGASIVHAATPVSGARPVVLLALAPTRKDAGTPSAPIGTWTVRVRNTRNTAVTVEAWIERDETPVGTAPRGRQSYFDDPQNVRFDALGDLAQDDSPDSYVSRFDSLNGIACGKETVVVGGVLEADGSIAPYSAAGPIAEPTTNRARRAPDCVEISDRSRVRRGVLAAGTRSGSTVSMNGTSVAAPRVARALVPLLGRTPQTARELVKSLTPNASRGAPDPRLGRGRPRRGKGVGE